MLHTRKPVWLLIGAAALTLLACTTVTRLTDQMLGRAAPTAAPSEAEPSQPGLRPLEIEGGPTIGTPRETRVALSEGRLRFLDELATETYTPEELARVGETFQFTVELDDPEERLLWYYGWCATTPEILEQNLEHMQFSATVNGQPVDLAYFETLDTVDQSGDQSLVCRSFVTIVYAWPSGTTTLEYKVTYEETINDGMADYPPGDQTFVYTVTAP